MDPVSKMLLFNKPCVFYVCKYVPRLPIYMGRIQDF